ncbi:MAG TPA: tRNA 2-thiouridine(34) synthase MnmA, partial [candidate division CPR3 bacterium]|nr:tRNA 2-thiouridine(34) synthase MnmA [candidate division CPR3 bacterium]
MKQKKVIVALSGGVDSSVSAALLKRDGFDVVGVFMKCWVEGEKCTSTEDEKMARLAAVKIGIPFYSLDLIKDYRKRVVDYMLKGYEKGITPNPDVMCNKEIKFGLFYDKALAMGADYVATGHYAQVRNGKILAGKDSNKDQSYFLSMINASVLSKVLFPIGKYTKPQVRTMARKFGLPTAERPDSQGLCFI